MKNNILLYSIIISLSSFNCWAQNKENLLNEKKIDGTATVIKMDNKIDGQNRKIKYYHVEETVSLNFGGHKTIYNVSKPWLIQTYNLGPNGKRVVTPIYSDGQQAENESTKKDSILKIKNTSLSINDASKILSDGQQVQIESPKKENISKIESINLSVNDESKKIDITVYLDIIKTFESAAGKGYDSIDMLKKVANAYFFINELEKAEKYYTKLFDKTSDLDPAYYFHYAVSLKEVGKIDKSKEYFKKFHQLTLDNAR